MGSWVNFNFFSEGCLPKHSSAGAAANTSLLLVTIVSFKLRGWPRSLLTGVGGGSPFAKYLARYLDFPNPPQTPSNILLLSTILNGLLTLNFARWYALYSCGKYSTSSGSSVTGHPPSYLATRSMACFLFDPWSCAPAPWTLHSLPSPVLPALESSIPIGALTENYLVEDDLWSGLYLCSVIGHPLGVYTLQCASWAALYSREASLSMTPAVLSPRATPT